MEATQEKVKKPRKITKKQKDWADKYLETGNKTQSALAAYNTTDPKTASVIGAENIGKPSIREYLDQNASAVAANMLRLALNAERESDQINAGKDVLDRAGYKPVEKTLNVNVEVDTTTKEELKAAAILNEIYRRAGVENDGVVPGNVGTETQDKE